ncbi:hypothetical protein SFRURICE_014384 [Spodoptera frugiperda]|nr:hypothetical protein SFRURICE_014384 [Spodoptera frugiperda]
MQLRYKTTNGIVFLLKFIFLIVTKCFLGIMNSMIEKYNLQNIHGMGNAETELKESEFKHSTISQNNKLRYSTRTTVKSSGMWKLSNVPRSVGRPCHSKDRPCTIQIKQIKLIQDSVNICRMRPYNKHIKVHGV